MTMWTALGAHLQAGAALPDTIVTKSVPVAEGWFATMTSVADGLMTLAILVLTVALVPAAWNFRKSYARINTLLDKVYGDITPIVRHTNAIADNLNYVTTSIRVDVQQVNQTVAAANQRLLDAVKLAERRLQEFNAVLGVVQSEAEEVFVSTASTLRGVRTGAAVLREDLLDERAAEVPLGTSADDYELMEETHGDDVPTEADDPWRARPRVRPRGYRRG